MIKNVSDTALWVAVYRAMETQRPDALFQDPWAGPLAGERGRRIVDELPGGRESAWATIVRTQAMDEMILDAVERRGADAVLNLAAGLDTRPYRLPLPCSLRWIEVDLPNLVEYKTLRLSGETPRCRLERVKADLSDARARAELLARATQGSSRVLVVSEGLLIYLDEAQVAALARDLAAAPALRWWLIDYCAPALVAFLGRKWNRQLAAGRAQFKFGVEDGRRFFGELGWDVAAERFASDEARRLRREMPHAWAWRLLGRLLPKAQREKFRGMNRFALLERSGVQGKKPARPENL